MAEYGITDTGEFQRKHVDAIHENLVDRARAEFGDDIDLSPGSPHQQLVDIAALELADLWESLEGVYYSAYFEDAFGIQIDRLLSIAGVGRIPRRPATGEVTFSTASPNNSDAPIPSGTRVATEGTETTPPIIFQTTERAVLRAGEGSVTRVPIRGLREWETNTDTEFLGDDTNVSSGTISQILDPVSGVDSVNNPLPTGANGERADGTEYAFTTGRDRESDSQLKTRYRESLSLGGNATLGAIRASVYNTDGVEAAGIQENTSMTDNTGSGGLPEKSFRVTYLGANANPDDIAQSILDTRSAGIESYGGQSGIGVLDDGSEYTESFDQATEVPIYVTANIDVDDTFATDGVNRASESIIRYIGGTLPDGTNVSGLNIAEDVVYDQVWSAIMNVDGVIRADVSVGTSSSPTGKTDIAISSGQAARTVEGNIDITTTVV